MSHKEQGRGSADNAVTVLEGKVPVNQVSKTAISTSQLPEKDQYAFWRENAQNLGLVDRPEPYGARFDAEFSNIFTSRAAFSTHQIRQTSSIRRCERHITDIHSDLLAIQLRLSGIESENNLGTGICFKPGDIRVMDLARPVYSANPHYQNFALIVHKRELRDRVPNLETLNGMTLKDTQMGCFLRHHMMGLKEAIYRIPGHEAERLGSISVDILVAALQSDAVPGMLESESLEMPVMRAVHHYIRQHLHEPELSAGQIAFSVGVSRAKLFRVCKPYGSPMELVRQHRLRQARQLLSQRKVGSVTEAAFSVGYENASSFSRSFQREFGFAARELLHV